MKIHHIGYLVKNIEESRKHFYILGFKDETEKLQDVDRRIFILFMINGDYRVELVEPMDSESVYSPLLKRFRNLPYHICYETDNMDETIRMLEDNYFLVSQSPKVASCLGKRKVAFLQSQELGIIELLECQSTEGED